MGNIVSPGGLRRSAVRRACEFISGFWHVVHRGADGRVLEEEFGHNLYHDEGERAFAEQFTGEYAWPTDFYLGLYNRVGSSYSVVGVDTTNDHFSVSGDVTAECTAGEPLRITGSSDGNDGLYTIASASYDSGNDETDIYTEESISGSTGDGTLTLFIITEADTLSDLVGEPDGTNGYSRQQCSVGTTDFSATQVDGDWQAETAVKTITASGGSIGPLNSLFMADSSDNTGRLWQSKALETEKTLADGESIDISLFVQFGE